jgi:hypothetical protein
MLHSTQSNLTCQEDKSMRCASLKMGTAIISTNGRNLTRPVESEIPVFSVRFLSSLCRSPAPKY